MYKMYETNGRYDIYSAYGQFIVSCLDKKTAEYLVAKLNLNAKLYGKEKDNNRG